MSEPTKEACTADAEGPSENGCSPQEFKAVDDLIDSRYITVTN